MKFLSVVFGMIAAATGAMGVIAIIGSHWLQGGLLISVGLLFGAGSGALWDYSNR